MVVIERPLAGIQGLVEQVAGALKVAGLRLTLR